jgi:hypothetical protein
MTNIPISKDLHIAFERTRYIVYTDTPIVLRIGKASADLQKLHHAHGARCSAFITAFNPDSVALTLEQNEERQRALKNELDKLGYPYYEGLGQPEDDDWQGEASFLVINIPEPEAVRLQEKYGQLAIVYCGEDAVPCLKFTTRCQVC